MIMNPNTTCPRRSRFLDACLDLLAEDSYFADVSQRIHNLVAEATIGSMLLRSSSLEGDHLVAWSGSSYPGGWDDTGVCVRCCAFVLQRAPRMDFSDPADPVEIHEKTEIRSYDDLDPRDRGVVDGTIHASISDTIFHHRLDEND